MNSRKQISLIYRVSAISFPGLRSPRTLNGKKTYSVSDVQSNKSDELKIQTRSNTHGNPKSSKT